MIALCFLSPTHRHPLRCADTGRAQALHPLEEPAGAVTGYGSSVGTSSEVGVLKHQQQLIFCLIYDPFTFRTT